MDEKENPDNQPEEKIFQIVTTQTLTVKAKNFPEWVRFIAQDIDGDWYGYDQEPMWDEGFFRRAADGRSVYITSTVPVQSMAVINRGDPSKLYRWNVKEDVDFGDFYER